MALPYALPMSAGQRGRNRALGRAIYLNLRTRMRQRRPRVRASRRIGQTEQTGDGQRGTSAQQAGRKKHRRILAIRPTSTPGLRPSILLRTPSPLQSTMRTIYRSQFAVAAQPAH